MVVAYAQNEYEAKHHIYYRLVQSMLIVIAILVIVALLKFTEFKFMDIFTSLVAFIPTGWGMILIAQVFRPCLQCTIVWNVVVSLARLYDILFGVIVMALWLSYRGCQGFSLCKQGFCSMKHSVGDFEYSRLLREKSHCDYLRVSFCSICCMVVIVFVCQSFTDGQV